jgi:hypothetical protein
MSARFTAADIEKSAVAGLNKTAFAPPKKYDFYIGIDTGVNTGFAVISKPAGKLVELDCWKIHTAMHRVEYYADNFKIFVYVEDARQAVHKRNTAEDYAKQQGAGSVKRDASIWEGFLTDLKVDFSMLRPNNKTTKLNAQVFKRVTGYQGQTNSHARDAAMLIWGR